VIMNLIFGVIMAAVAYKIGTPIQPASVGRVSYGSNAWLAGWEPGYDLVGFSESDVASHFYRFTWDLRYAVIGGGMDDTTGIPFRVVNRDGVESISKVQPIQSGEDSKQVTIGIIAASNATVVSAGSLEQLQIGDQIIKVDGVPIKRDTHGPRPDLLGWHATQLIAADPTKTLTLTVLRAGEELQVAIPPVSLKQPHVSFGMGPVVGVIPGSVGEEVGFLKGDVIQSVNGEPVGDPVTLPQRMANLTGKRVVFQVSRSIDGQTQSTQEITVESLPVSHFLTPAAPYSKGCLQGLGVAYGCDNIVATSKIAGVQPGDRLDSVQLVKTPANQKQVDARKLQKQPLGDYLSWFYIHQTGQVNMTGFNLQLNFSRDHSDQQIAVITEWEDSPENFSWERGIMFAPLERVHQASGWGDAFQLGLRRTGQDMSRVGQTIGWIAGGKASVSDLGGPVMIIKVAKDEAAVDVTRLLLFLTMLSANLAIINFLPIPILDGGHFVFLTIELIRRKPVSERIQGSLSMIFLVALLGFMVFIVSNDVFRLWIQ